MRMKAFDWKKFAAECGMVPSDEQHFPHQRCVIPDKREPTVLNAQGTYLVMLLDVDNPHRVQLRSDCVPYVSTEGDDFWCGWMSMNGPVFDNIWRPIHTDDEVVVAFKELNVPK
jgi:hypothetical protein